MDNEPSEAVRAEQEQLEIENKTRALYDVSGSLFEKRRNFHQWTSAIEGQINNAGAVKAQSHDERNYNQSFHFVGKTKVGENPSIGEFQYGDDFHKGNGIPKLISYTAHRYRSDGSQQIETLSSTGDSPEYFPVYVEEVNPDGSKIVKEQKGKDWTTTEYDPAGNVIEKK